MLKTTFEARAESKDIVNIMNTKITNLKYVIFLGVYSHTNRHLDINKKDIILVFSVIALRTRCRLFMYTADEKFT